MNTLYPTPEKAIKIQGRSYGDPSVGIWPEEVTLYIYYTSIGEEGHLHDCLKQAVKDYLDSKIETITIEEVIL